MKKYRIRKGSIAWFVVENKKALAVLGTILIIITAFSAVSAFANSASGQVVAEPEKVAEIAKESFTGYNVPLDIELQKYIEEQSMEKGIEPELVLAVIGVESNYRADAIGDNGQSFGLMQVQERWHKARMDKLGCDNLLNPYENVLVGIDILSEKLEKYGDVEKALCAYNAGDAGAYKLYFSKGIYFSEYSRKVMAKAEELKGGDL